MNAHAPATNRRRMTQGINVVALAGRRIDATDTSTPRFPLDHAPVVQRRILAVLQQTKASVLVCSAACGADLLALEAARKLGLGVCVILPLAREQFRETWVVDRPGNWGALFDQLMDEAEQVGAVWELEPGSQDTHLRVVDAILDQAIDCGSRTRNGRASGTPGLITAVAVWDGQSWGESDVTEAFLQRARARGVTLRHVSTN